jgi:hypothetical protein
MYSRLSPGLETLLVHPPFGMAATKLMAIARDPGESQRLVVCAWDVLDIGWIVLPYISSRIVEPLQRRWSDVVAFMAFEGWNQDVVLERIESFLVRISRSLLSIAS